MLPTVSVIIPTFNRAKVLPRAINSVLAQSYQDFEIIVIDDGSTDNTDEVMSSFNDRRIRYLKHSENMGGSAARNTGIRESIGEFVAFLDSDDEWLPGILSRQIELFNQKNNSYGLVCTNYLYDQFDGTQTTRLVECKRGCVFNDIMAINWIGALPSVMVRLNYLKKVGGFDERLKSCQDWDLYIRLSKVCLFDYIDEVLVRCYTNIKERKRISSNYNSVISGHKMIEWKYRDEYKLLPVSFKLKHYAYMREVFSVGDWKMVIKLSLKSFFISRDYRNLLTAPRLIYRCFKKNILRWGGCWNSCLD